MFVFTLDDIIGLAALGLFILVFLIMFFFYIMNTIGDKIMSKVRKSKSDTAEGEDERRFDGRAD